MVKVIGVDPGLNKTGWAIVEKRADNSFKFINCGFISTSAKDAMPMRLRVIHNSLNDVLQIHQPKISAIEETYVNTNYGSSLKLAHARSAAILTLSLFGIDVGEYSAKTVKKAITGSGSADKVQVKYMVSKILAGVPQGSGYDENDAIAIALCHGLHHASVINF
jgi:crossover junction endodeoxyribonuclease RuvC